MRSSETPSILSRVRNRSTDERGAILVLVAIMMVVFMGFAALSIDLGSFDQAQRQAQAAADAGALASAQDLSSSPGSASADGTTYAQKNFPGSTVSVDATSTTNQVTVSVTASTPVFFGKLFGLASETVGAKAVATLTPGASSCATPGTGCYAVFAKDTSCSGGVTFQGGGYTITGGVQSDGGLNLGGGGSTFGTTHWGTSCTPVPNPPTNAGTFTPAGSATAAAPIPFPIDYTTSIWACGTTGKTCGASGTPSYCSASAASYSFTGAAVPSTGYIYCAYGTGTKSNPATWNGTITFSGGSIGSLSNPVVASYIAGSVFTGSGGEYFQACGYAKAGYTASRCLGATGQTMPAPATYNYPLIYAADTDVQAGSNTYAVNLGGGGNFWNGDIFAPVGTITVAAGSQPITFLEGFDVKLLSGGITGDGTSVSGTSGSSSGSEALTQ